ncbi:MAG TPA: hypothetical protein PKA84_15790, partial [Rubrivivax sp.]|nr:hypothetical protein [Rubrivivax sp.]
IGQHIVPIIPDEARTFGMEAMFPEFGIYSSKGQLYEPVDRKSLSYYHESKTGQILEEGITEAGSRASFVAAGTAYDARPMGERLGTLQRAGGALARVGLDDHGSFDFAGRLRVPLAAVEPTGLGAWFQAHPDGVALWRLPPQDDDAGRAARARQFWRGQMLVLIDATQWPAWADRAAAGPGPETARQRLR